GGDFNPGGRVGDRAAAQVKPDRTADHVSAGVRRRRKRRGASADADGSAGDAHAIDVDDRVRTGPEEGVDRVEVDADVAVADRAAADGHGVGGREVPEVDAAGEGAAGAADRVARQVDGRADLHGPDVDAPGE